MKYSIMTRASWIVQSPKNCISKDSFYKIFPTYSADIFPAFMLLYIKHFKCLKWMWVNEKTVENEKMLVDFLWSDNFERD